MSTPPQVSETSQTPRSTLFFRPANPQTPRSPALEPAACPIASYPAVSGTSRPAAAKARGKGQLAGSGSSPAKNIPARAASLRAPPIARSEEHTSELQSHHDLVCRLLLEKKN